MDNIVELLHIGDVAEYQRLVGLLGDVHHTDYQFTGSHKITHVFAEVLSNKYDVILLDYHWQGGETARDILISATNQSCDTPIIVMTDEMEADVDREAIGLGASDYLIKGRIDSQLLERTIRYAIERKNAERKLARLAHFDPLTNIPNRILFRDRLEHALKLAERGRRTFTLLFIDLDGFKQINDKYGHDTGDQLLQSCADRICKCIRKSDTVARIGGDEFTVLLEHTDSTSNIVRITKKIIRALQQPHSLDNHEVFVGCSIGIAVYPDAGTDVDSLQKHADMAMYEAKQSPNEDFRFFTEAMNREASQQSQLINDLYKAVEQRNFSLHYEPVIDLATRQLAAFKIRTRWLREEDEWIDGDTLIELADDAGLSGALGYWTIHKLMEHSQHLAQLPTVSVIVPLAPRQLYDQQYIQHIKEQSDKLKQTQIRLILEINEATLTDHHELVRSFMQAVQAPQVSFALSHVGLGAISLEWLNAMPFTQLVLASELCDEFVQGRSKKIMRALMALAKSFNLTVMAEAVDDKQKWVALEKIGCQTASGLLFGNPLSWEQVQEKYILQRVKSLDDSLSPLPQVLEH